MTMGLTIGYKKHLTLPSTSSATLCCLLLVIVATCLPVGLVSCTCLSSSSSREKRDSPFNTRLIFPATTADVVDNNSSTNETLKRVRGARSQYQTALDMIKYGSLPPDHPNRIKTHRKRCRYSDDEFEALKSSSLVDNSNVNFNSNPSGSIQSYYISKVKLNNPNGQQHHHIKQPKVRDQFHNRPSYHNNGDGSDSSSASNNIEKETLFVNTGDMINLTCHLSSKEVDWHFKDRNLTTTVLSYGLQLQVAQPVLFEMNQDGPVATRITGDISYDISEDYQSPDDLFETPSNEKSSSSGRIQQRNTAYSHHSPHVFKYRVSSDHELTHVLSVYVQGPQDEGSYQCIDSKSESPIKKTIQVYLRSTRALLSNANRLTTTHLIPIYTIFVSVLFMLLNSC